MRSPTHCSPRLLLISLVLLAGPTAVQHARAGDYYWDADGAGSGTGGTGSWLAANTWRSGSDSGSVTSWSDGNNAYFGGTAGTVTLGGSVSPVTAFFTVNNYSLQTDGTTTIRDMAGNISLSSGVNLNLNNSSASNSRTLRIGGDISGGSGITIQGNQSSSNASRIFLSLANSTVSSAVTINMTATGVGGLVADATGVSVSGTITNNSSGATLIGATDTNSLTLTSTAVISGSQGVRFGTGTSSLPAGAGGTITLNSQSTYSGATEFRFPSGGVVRLGVDNALPTGTAVSFGGASGSASSGGTLDLNSFNQTIAALTTSSNPLGGIVNNANGTTSTLTINGSATSGSFDLVIADNSNSGTGTVALVRGGTGTTTLGAQNTYTGGTTVSGGTLALGHSTNTLADTGAVTVSGGTLSLGSNSDTVGAVTLASGSITGSGTLTGSSYDVRSGTVSAILGGSAALTKSTSGTVTLSGANSYSGGTAINGGTLLVTGSVGGGTVSVNNGGTLGGDGNTGFAAVTVANGGTIAPGLGGTTTGKLTFDHGLTFLTGSALQMQIHGTTPGTDFDQLIVTAETVSLTGNLSVSIDLSSPTGNEQFVIIQNSGSVTLSGTFSNYADGATVATSGGFEWKIYYGPSSINRGGDGNDVVIVASPVPEPGSIIAICAGVAGVSAGVRRCRRRRNAI